MLKDFDKIESITIKRKGLQEKKDFEDMNISEKIECISLLIARMCYEEYKKCNGTEMNFTTSGICDKETKKNLGNVNISWRLE